jgi:hypothetical protein
VAKDAPLLLTQWFSRKDPRRPFGQTLAFFLLAIAWAHAASAHLTPNSQLQIDFGVAEARLDIIIPQTDYASASGNRIGDRAQARAYLEGALGAKSPSGLPGRSRSMWWSSFKSPAPRTCTQALG